MAKKHSSVRELLADPSHPLRLLVSWSPQSPGTEVLDFCASLAQSTPVRIRILTTTVQPWGTASLTKLGGKFKKWLRAEAEASEKAAKRALEAAGIERNNWAKRFSVFATGPSHPILVTEAAADFRADLILLSPNQSAPKNKVMAGSSADTLLHFSPVTLGLTPRGLKPSKHGVTQVNFAFTDANSQEDYSALFASAALASRWQVPLRIVVFIPTGISPASLNTKIDVVLESISRLQEEALALLDRARDAVAAEYPEVETLTGLGMGQGWGAAVSSLKWKKGDIMCLGSNPMSPLERVFIGSTATELLPHLSVPVLVHPVVREDT